ncbi:MAG: tetratricopeptide repeat protein [Coraliomargaritaceae bacterium]
MPKATLKSTIRYFFILTLFLSGCSDPIKQRAQKLEQAAESSKAGEYLKAEELLNQLAQDNPEDLTVLLARADLYQAQDKKVQAALALQQAQQLAPDDINLLYRTIEALQVAEQPRGNYLEDLAKRAPESMPPELWEQLGALRSSAGQTQAALDAYLEANSAKDHTPSPESAAAIGQLFLKLNNLPQAERWFRAAAESDDLNALSALFGLLEIYHRNKDWATVELILEQLQEQFPGSIKASHWAKLPEEIKTWRAAQEALQAELVEKTNPVEESVDGPSEEESGSNTETSDEATIAETTKEDTQETTDAPSGKETALADLEAAIAMADKPAVEEDLVPQEDFVAAPPPPPLPDPAQLVEDARLAEQERDFATAIQLYWQALSQANESSEIWNRLSQAYLIDGQIQNAETAALESLRLSPEEEGYMLDYLRIIQRTKTLPEFLIELQTAYDRFPQNPDIVLSLARAYERIDGREESAANAYRRFIQLAPDHHLRPEAETALNRLL